MKSNSNAAVLLNSSALEPVIPLFSLKSTMKHLVKVISMIGEFYLNHPAINHHTYFSVNPWGHHACTRQARRNDTIKL